MSSIDSVGSSSLLSALNTMTSSITMANSITMDAAGQTDPMSKVMASVAALFGMSTGDLQKARQSGTTLAQLAQSKGISSDTLTSTLSQALQANAPANAPSGVNYTQMATDMINGTGGHGHHHHGGGGSPVPSSTGDNTSSSGLSGLLSSLGVDPSELAGLLSSDSSSSTSSSTTSAFTSDASSATNGTTTGSTDQTDFVTQLKNLISQYGSKGNLYDTAL